MSNCENFERFLQGINLDLYREKYARIKLVELDMPKFIRPIDHLYREYWERRAKYPDFDSFYRIYRHELSPDIEAFRDECLFSEETFERGLPARIYRTWASLLTQIQGGYAAESLYGVGNVRMSAPLDYNGVDIQLQTEQGEINIQIKKETLSREARQPKPKKRKEIKIVEITYEVPGCAPVTPKTGRPSQSFERWQEKWRGKLKRLDNGFIVFLPAMVAPDNLRTDFN